MTDEEKLTMLKSMTEETDNDVLSTYLFPVPTLIRKKIKFLQNMTRFMLRLPLIC